MASEARTDSAMLLGLLFLLIVGAGPWSRDASFSGRVQALWRLLRFQVNSAWLVLGGAPAGPAASLLLG